MDNQLELQQGGFVTTIMTLLANLNEMRVVWSELKDISFLFQQVVKNAFADGGLYYISTLLTTVNRINDPNDYYMKIKTDDEAWIEIMKEFNDQINFEKILYPILINNKWIDRIKEVFNYNQELINSGVFSPEHFMTHKKMSLSVIDIFNEIVNKETYDVKTKIGTFNLINKKLVITKNKNPIVQFTKMLTTEQINDPIFLEGNGIDPESYNSLKSVVPYSSAYEDIYNKLEKEYTDSQNFEYDIKKPSRLSNFYKSRMEMLQKSKSKNKNVQMAVQKDLAKLINGYTESKKTNAKLSEKDYIRKDKREFYTFIKSLNISGIRGISSKDKYEIFSSIFPVILRRRYEYTKDVKTKDRFEEVTKKYPQLSFHKLYNQAGLIETSESLKLILERLRLMANKFAKWIGGTSININEALEVADNISEKQIKKDVGELKIETIQKIKNIIKNITSGFNSDIDTDFEEAGTGGKILKTLVALMMAKAWTKELDRGLKLYQMVSTQWTNEFMFHQIGDIYPAIDDIISMTHVNTLNVLAEYINDKGNVIDDKWVIGLANKINRDISKDVSKDSQHSKDRHNLAKQVKIVLNEMPLLVPSDMIKPYDVQFDLFGIELGAHLSMAVQLDSIGGMYKIKY
jgi:hypothetical protein